ncbi:XLF-domain-containing protein [Colletotrichum zoysiae]|uniref:Non-homologous end-joining factor 1 n=1 Tax=Colletotrichum zoysiae TaxID=1216348 RepID=A0AAD9H1H7_9PEZI|nr:XLF-domain-containing protein [Colletotrichum zoysiae]
MTTPPVWRQLPVSSSTGLPNLLVSTSFSTTSYTIHLTDLANIWVESLDRKAIYKRSLNESTSIDPTDSDSNMRAFLSKIRSVFDTSHQDHAEASLSLSTIPSNEAGPGGLTLSIVCKLENTKPLEWPMYLQKCPQSQLASELVVPLAQAHKTGRRQINSLKDIIRQKDAIITRLLDKLEATGTRLENVFNVLSAKQKPTRKMAEDKVKGLAPFRSEDWMSQLDGEYQEDMSSLVQSVFGADGLEYRRNPDVHDAASLDDWWMKLQPSSIPIVDATSSSRLNQPGVSSSNPGQPESKGVEVAAEDDDDDFQVQSTPPHLMATRKRSVHPPPAENGDDVAKDGDTQPIPDSVPVPPLENNARPPRLGTIGKRHQPMPARTSPPPQALGPEGSETETESDEDATASIAEASSPLQRAGPISGTKDPKRSLGTIGDEARGSNAVGSPRKGALGRIGGESARSKSPEPPKRPGLGRIGGGARPVKTPEPTAIAAEERGRSRVDTTVREKPRETSRERADRKRDELQKDLQRKAAAGPARKKRKF